MFAGIHLQCSFHYYFKDEWTFYRCSITIRIFLLKTNGFCQHSESNTLLMVDLVRVGGLGRREHEEVQETKSKLLHTCTYFIGLYLLCNILSIEESINRWIWIHKIKLNWLHIFSAQIHYFLRPYDPITVILIIWSRCITGNSPCLEIVVDTPTVPSLTRIAVTILKLKSVNLKKKH